MIKVFIVLSLLANAGLAEPAADVVQILKKMTVAARTNNYQANLVLSKGNKLTTLMMEHRASQGSSREWERLVSLQGTKQETVVDGARMLVLLPNGKRDRVLRNPLADTFLNLHHSLEKYTVKFLGTDRVAGRVSNVLHIRAKDKYHYSYLLWLDKDTGVYLRAQWLDNAEDIKFEAMFTSITFKSVKNEDLNVNVQNIESTMLASKSIEKLNQANMVEVGWLPSGFTLLKKLTHPPEGPGRTEHLVFGDGTIKVSVYIDMKDAVTTEGPLDFGRTCGFSLNVADKNITVLGEMPGLTLKKIAQSVVLK